MNIAHTAPYATNHTTNYHPPTSHHATPHSRRNETEQVPQLGSASAEEEEDCQAAVPLSRLKGVFKSFNGGVKVRALTL